MHEQDVRWEQRFSNYIRAFDKLEEAVTYLMTSKEKEIISEEDEFVFDMLKESLIQRFEYTHELAWNVMKDYAHYQGNAGVGGSRDATREAFSLGLIENGKIWMDMISSRNQTSHTYDEEIANKIYNKVIESYYPAFLAFRNVMEAKKSESN